MNTIAKRLTPKAMKTGKSRKLAIKIIARRARPEIMAADLVSLLNDEQRRTQMLKEIRTVKTLMGAGGASNKVATLIRQLCEKA